MEYNWYISSLTFKLTLFDGIIINISYCFFANVLTDSQHNSGFFFNLSLLKHHICTKTLWDNGASCTTAEEKHGRYGPENDRRIFE